MELTGHSESIDVTDGELKSRAYRMSSRLLIGVVLLVIVFFGLIRFRLRDFPLERDEGEYAYAGQLMLQGVPPYLLAYNMKLPGTYGAYAISMLIFGQSVAGIHLGLIFINAATSILVGLLTLQLFGRAAGVAAAISYATLSTSTTVLGLAGHATHFVMLPAIGGLLLLIRSEKSRSAANIFLSGFLLGLAFVMKQPGLFFPIFGGLYLLYTEYESKRESFNRSYARIAIYSLGATLPFLIVCLLLFRAGVFQKFWFWTFSYAKAYGTIVRPGKAIANFRMIFPQVVGSSILLWLIAAVGTVSLFWRRPSTKKFAFAFGFLVFSALAVCPGFYFREHYFILVLPAVALFAGITIASISELMKRFQKPGTAIALPTLLLLIAVAYPVYAQRRIYFLSSPDEASRQVYGVNPFPEARVVADYIKANSAPSDRIAVIGSEPEIYFYSARRSATGYIYTYGLVEKQQFALQMQKEMIAEIEASKPEYLVAVRVPTSWLQQPDSPGLIFDWASDYIRKDYYLVGVSDIKRQSQFVSGAAAGSYVPKSPYAMFVFRRRRGN